MPALYTVVWSEVATSAAAGPEASTSAVWISVGAPPKATPHRAADTSRTAGAPAYRPSASITAAHRARVPSSVPRSRRSTSRPVAQIPATVDAPNTSSTTSGRPKPVCAANGATYVYIA